MSAVNEAGLLEGFELYDQLHEQISDRTREILEHRRRTRIVRSRGWLVRRVLLAADLVGLLSALLLAEFIITAATHAGALSARDEILVFLVSLPAWVVIAKLYGLYDHDEESTDHSTVDDFGGVFHMVTVCTWSFWMITQLTHVAHPTAPKLVIFWAAAVGFISVGRATARALARKTVAYIQNTVIVGAGDVGQLIAKKLLNHPEYGINLVGFVDAQPKERREDLEHLALLGDTSRLAAIIRLFDVERVIIAFSNDSHRQTLDLLHSIDDSNVQIDIVPRLFEVVGPGVGIHTVEGLPLVGLPPVRLARSSRLLKRCLDLALSVPALVVLMPVFVVVGVLVKLDSPGPIFFRQVRMGCGDRTFRIFKFRSMQRDAEAHKREVAHLNKHLGPGGDARMFKVPNDPRITRVGRVLRKYSLDELPQLINVVLGHMSLVGARPLILEEDESVEDWGRRRLDLKPGVTGVWQVLGRSAIPFEEMVRLDYLYVQNWSLWQDLRLVFMTLPALLRGAEG